MVPLRGSLRDARPISSAAVTLPSWARADASGIANRPPNTTSAAHDRIIVKLLGSQLRQCTFRTGPGVPSLRPKLKLQWWNGVSYGCSQFSEETGHKVERNHRSCADLADFAGLPLKVIIQEGWGADMVLEA